MSRSEFVKAHSFYIPYHNMMHINQRKGLWKNFVDLCHLLWYVCVAEKVNTNLGDERL